MMSHHNHYNDSFMMNIDPNQNIYFFNKQKSYDSNTYQSNSLVKTNMFSIMQTNIRSQPKNLSNFVTLLKLLNNVFSWIGIYETWLNTSSPTNMLNIPNYVYIHKSRKSKKVALKEFISTIPTNLKKELI